MTPLVLCLVIASIPLADGPQDPAALLAAGNELYRQGLFEDALVKYHDADEAGGDPGVLAFNRGNCLFRQGFHAEALYQYLVAERHRPRDASVRANIAAAAARLGTAVPAGKDFSGLFRKAAGTFRADEYRAAGALLAALFFIAAAAAFRRGRVPALRWTVMLLVPGLLLYALSIAVADGPRGRAAVVVGEAALVFNEPARSGDVLFSLREGEIVAVEDARGKWLLVSDSEGHQGWARTSEVREVISDFVADKVASDLVEDLH
jgi:tetratricopeptide (TPR) repeat protein